MAKDRDYNKLIHTTRWLRLRKEVLTRHPLCQRCQDEGRVTAATEVHHIRPVEDAHNYREKIQRMYDPNNLRTLCHGCHVATHTELGRSGKAATKKKNEEQVRQIVVRFFHSNEDGG